MKIQKKDLALATLGGTVVTLGTLQGISQTEMQADEPQKEDQPELVLNPLGAGDESEGLKKDNDSLKARILEMDAEIAELKKAGGKLLSDLVLSKKIESKYFDLLNVFGQLWQYRYTTDHDLFKWMHSELTRLNKHPNSGVQADALETIKNLQKQLLEKEAKIQEHIKSHQETLAELVEANKRFDDVKDTISQQSEDLQELQDKLAKLSDENVKAKGEAELYKTLISKYDQERNKLLVDLNELKTIKQELAVLKVTMATQTIFNKDLCTINAENTEATCKGVVFGLNPDTWGWSQLPNTIKIIPND